MTITSPHNPKLKDLRRLQRRHKGAARFVAEGEDLLAAADAAGWPRRRFRLAFFFSRMWLVKA